MPATGGNVAAAQPPSLHLDSIDASGSYTASRIDIAHALLLRGDTRVTLSGSLAAAPDAPANFPEFDGNSVLHAHVEAAKVSVDDLQPFLVEKLPLSGTIDTQFQADGPLRTLDGSGWAQLADGVIYGEPVSRIRVQGTIAGSQVNLASIAVGEAAGNITATGSYDLNSKRFSVNAKAAGIDVAKIGRLNQQGWSATGSLTFDLHGSGTFDDPEIQGNATLNNLAFGGEPIGALQLVAHTANHALTYDMTTRLDAAELTVHGDTALKPRLPDPGPPRLLPLQHRLASQAGPRPRPQRPVGTGRHCHRRWPARAS